MLNWVVFHPLKKTKREHHQQVMIQFVTQQTIQSPNVPLGERHDFNLSKGHVSHSRGPQKGHKLTRAAFARKMGIRTVYLDVLLEVRINGFVITYLDSRAMLWMVCCWLGRYGRYMGTVR